MHFFNPIIINLYQIDLIVSSQSLCSFFFTAIRIASIASYSENHHIDTEIRFKNYELVTFSWAPNTFAYTVSKYSIQRI